MKGQGGGGTAKGGGKNKSKGGKSKNVATKEKSMASKEIDNNIILLRKALRNDDGTDKDVTAGLAPAFMKYERNGLNLKIRFETGKSISKEPEVLDWMFNLVKESMKEHYNASGYGWDDDDKILELAAPEGRFLIVSEADGSDVAFCHFRFTVTGEVIDKMEGNACVQIFDIHIEESTRRKALGKHLLTMVELIGRREKVPLLTMPIQIGDLDTEMWLRKAGRNLFTRDAMVGLKFDAETEGFYMYSKSLVPVPKTTNTTVPTVQAPSVKNEHDSVSNTNSKSAVEEVCHVFTTASETALTDSKAAKIAQDQKNKVITELSDMYREKHGKDPAKTEIDKWTVDLESLDLNDLSIHAAPQTGKNEKSTVKDSFDFTDDDGWTLIDT